MAAIKAAVPVSIEPLTAEQLLTVSRLQQLAMASVWSLTQWQQVLADRYFARVALNNGVIIAVAVVSTVLDEAELETVFVHPSYRSRGEAGKLLDACFKELPATVSKVFLEVDAENAAAIKLYERNSFQVINKRKGYYTHSQGNGDALIMLRQQ